MTRLATYFNEAINILTKARIATARLDALVLLEDILGIDRVHILAEPHALVRPEQSAHFLKLIRRRAAHEPLAYIRQKTEFYGREFYIDYHVLEPRPESEMMIELLKSLRLGQEPTIIDVGTGSGALGITAKLEFPRARTICIDIDRGCLKIAARNATMHYADIEIYDSDLIANIPAIDLCCAVLLCNLPYVPDDFHINTAATHEPKIAIFGGTDGLSIYRKLFRQIAELKEKPMYILTESLPPSHKRLSEIAGGAQYVLEHSNDFIQVFKIAAGSSVL